MLLLTNLCPLNDFCTSKLMFSCGGHWCLMVKSSFTLLQIVNGIKKRPIMDFFSEDSAEWKNRKLFASAFIQIWTVEGKAVKFLHTSGLSVLMENFIAMSVMECRKHLSL